MIGSIPPIGGYAVQALESVPETSNEKLDFQNALGTGLQKLNTDLNASDEVLRAMAAGQNIPVHDVMIVMEQAQLSLQFAVQMRNRLVSAYQQITQMQV